MIEFNSWHDGLIFKPAFDVAKGKTLYRDVYYLYGALTALLHAVTLKIITPKLIYIRLLTSLFYGFIVVLLWVIWSRFLPNILNTLACLIWIALAPYYYLPLYPWSSVYSLFTQLSALYLAILYLESKQNIQKQAILIFMAGIFTSLTFWFRQPVGIFLIIVMMIFFVFDCYLKKYNYKDCLKTLSLFLIGNVIPTVIILGYLFANDAIKDWWLQSIYHNYLMAKATGNSYNMTAWIKTLINSLFAVSDYVCSLSSSPNSYDRFIWVFFPVITLFVLANELSLLKRDPYKMYNDKLFLILIVCLSSWMQYYPVPSIDHFYWAATPMIGLSVYFFSDYINKLYYKVNSATKGFRILFALLFFISLFQSVYFRVISGIENIKTKCVTITVPDVLKYMKTTTFTFKQLQEIDSLLKIYSKGGEHPYLTGVDQIGNTFVRNNVNYFKVYFKLFFLDDIYPQRTQKLYEFIREKKPIIYTSGGVEFIADGYCPKRRFVPEHYPTIAYAAADTDYFFVPTEVLNKKILEIQGYEIKADNNKIFIKNLDDDEVIVNSIYIRYNEISSGISSVYLDQTKLTLTLNNNLIPFNMGDLNLKLSKGDIVGLQYVGQIGNPLNITFCINSNYYSSVKLSH
ncbi:MAG: hypothetical protein HQK92_10580 [Nitrospirae bacterium]|nr:hypothetical protein [Nitrospirota bacterium]